MYHEYTDRHGNLIRRHYNSQRPQTKQLDLVSLASARAAAIERHQARFVAALEQLQAADPAWETWYDDNANIPAEIHWLDGVEIAALVARMQARAQKVSGRRCDRS